MAHREKIPGADRRLRNYYICTAQNCRDRTKCAGYAHAVLRLREN